MTARERILRAGSVAELLPALAAARGGDAPAPADLAAWLPECPRMARVGAAVRMDRVAHALMATVPLHTPLDWLHPAPGTPPGATVTISPTTDLDTGEIVGERREPVVIDVSKPRVVRPIAGAAGAAWLTGPTAAAAAMATFARRWLLDRPDEAGWFTPSGHEGATDAGAWRLHSLWLIAREHAHTLKHPIAPLVAAWQDRATERAPRVLGKRGSLPRLGKLGADEARLPDFPNDGPPAPVDGQLLLDLPDFGDVVRGCTSWLLWLFDQAGGAGKPGPGRGARWDMRLFVYALLNLDVADRDGAWHTLALPTLRKHADRLYEATGRRVQSVEEWLHPNGWANERRDWHKLPEALDLVRQRLSYLPVPGVGRVAMLFPSVIPVTRDHPLTQFTIRVPRAAANGDRLNWPRLLAYGAESDRLIRAYLAVVAWLGRSARNGHPITRQIAAPVLRPDGKPARRKGGRIIRSATERTDNPAACYVGPPLSEDALTRMIGFDASDKRRRHDARTAFERMEADRVLEIVRDGRGWQLFGGANW